MYKSHGIKPISALKGKILSKIPQFIEARLPWSEIPEAEDRSSDKKTFGNPYQYVFQQMMDETIADENVYEIPETRGKQGERPYAFGRPSSGGVS